MKAHHYLLVLRSKTRCPTCQDETPLLIREDSALAKFYVCWTCRAIFQVGVGKVKEETR